MAPRKKTEKEEKATSAESSDMILHYLQAKPIDRTLPSTFQPTYVTKSRKVGQVAGLAIGSEDSAIDDHAAATVKLLKDLHEQNLIEGRAAGKQLVYHALQNPNDAITPEQLSEYDTRVSTLQAQTTELQALAKTLRNTLISLNSTLSTADMISSMLSLEQEKTEIATRLESLRAGHAKKVTVEERQKVEREWNLIKGVSSRREQIAKEFWQMVEDGTEGKEILEDLREGWGLDD